MVKRKKSKAKKRLLAGQIQRTDGDELVKQKAGAQRLLRELHYKKSIVDDDEVQLDKNDSKSIPRSIIVKNGKINKSLQELVLDLRKMMSPFTALNLKERTKANMKDYVAVSGHVMHFFIFIL